MISLSEEEYDSLRTKIRKETITNQYTVGTNPRQEYLQFLGGELMRKTDHEGQWWNLIINPKIKPEEQPA